MAGALALRAACPLPDAPLPALSPQGLESTLCCDLFVFITGILSRTQHWSIAPKPSVLTRLSFPLNLPGARLLSRLFSQEAPAEIFIGRNCAMGVFSYLSSSASLDKGEVNGNTV
jgi:hypothetical protein